MSSYFETQKLAREVVEDAELVDDEIYAMTVSHGLFREFADAVENTQPLDRREC